MNDEDVGYIKGSLDIIKEENRVDHAEIKDNIRRQTDRLQIVCEEVSSLRTTTDRHEVALTKIGSRVDTIEYKQKYVEGLARFVLDHPRLVIITSLAIIILATGLGIDELWKLIRGGV